MSVGIYSKIYPIPSRDEPPCCGVCGGALEFGTDEGSGKRTARCKSVLCALPKRQPDGVERCPDCGSTLNIQTTHVMCTTCSYFR